VISAHFASILRCPQCHGTLTPSAAPASSPSKPTEAEPATPNWTLVCSRCGEVYQQHTREFVDLRPPTAFAEQTKYLDEALHVDARHETVSPPLLQAGVRQRQLQRFLQFQPNDRVIDLGCGSGRSLLWNAGSGAAFVGTDVSPFFAREARARMDLALADLRRLPFAEATFTKAYALDVLEHLSPDALDAMLHEAARVLVPGGALFVYSHVRKNAPIAAGLRAINALARSLERRGLIDMTQERLRKSDHVNPLNDIPHLERVVANAGFRIAKIRYYTPLIGGFIENVLMRMTERALTRRAAKQLPPEPAPSGSNTPAQNATAVGAVRTTTEDATAAVRAARATTVEDSTAAVRAARTTAKARIARGGPLAWSLHALTTVMHLDMLLLGRIRSGPFFALLVKDPAHPTGKSVASVSPGSRESDPRVNRGVTQA
jgi:SAM-dependent methyltransferase